MFANLNSYANLNCNLYPPFLTMSKLLLTLCIRYLYHTDIEDARVTDASYPCPVSITARYVHYVPSLFSGSSLVPIHSIISSLFHSSPSLITFLISFSNSVLSARSNIQCLQRQHVFNNNLSSTTTPILNLTLTIEASGSE